MALDGRDCLVLGAGGSARAVVYALASAGGRVTVLARRPEQAAQLVAELGTALPGATLTTGALAADYKGSGRAVGARRAAIAGRPHPV